MVCRAEHMAGRLTCALGRAHAAPDGHGGLSKTAGNVCARGSEQVRVGAWPPATVLASHCMFSLARVT